MKKLKALLIILSLTAVLVLPYFVFAQESATNTPVSNNPLNKLRAIGSDQGPYQAADEYTLSEILGQIAAAFLSLLAVIFIILIVLAGYNWLTAGGNEQKIEKAKNTMTRSIIGLVIILGAWAIWTFIVNSGLIPVTLK